MTQTQEAKNTNLHRLHRSYEIEEGVFCISFNDLTEEEQIKVLRWRNHPGVRSQMYHKQTISLAEHKNFLAQLPTQEKKFYWLLKEGDTDLGVIDIVDYREEASEWGFYLNPDLFGKGKATHLLFHALNFFFKTLKFSKLYGFCHYKNIRALLFHDLFYIFHHGYRKINTGDTSDWYSHRVIEAETWLKQKVNIPLIKERAKIHKLATASVTDAIRRQINHIDLFDEAPSEL